MAEVVRINPTNFELQTYEVKDSELISGLDIELALTSSSYIEFYLYDLNQNILSSNLNYTSYRVENDGIGAQNDEITQFQISPEDDVTNAGYVQGEYFAYYNFLSKQIGDQFTNLYISEISSDRTEIKLDSNVLTALDIVEQTNQFIQFREDQTYFVDFYLNFGNNQLVIANNIQLENETTDDPTILVKLYEPLPTEFNEKSLLWIVTTLNEPEAFKVTYPVILTTFTDFTSIQGPNFNIPIKGQVNNSSQLLSENDIISGAPTSSMDQIESILNEKSLNISVDYTNFTDFIHFSSGKTRLENFYYKASLIEGYSSSIAALSNTTSSATSILILQNKISDIIKNFDGYDRFLYYTSGSEQTWPKTTTEPPYLLAKTGSAAVVNWLGSDDEVSAYYGGMILSASNYDNQNNDQLLKSIPEYLREDSANQQYELFVDMVAQYYDNVWLYTKDITQKYNADNRLDSGISKDLVADAIKDFGLKLYQNNFSNSELYTAFLGLTPSGSLFPFPNITGSTPVPSGYELVDTLISASNDVISMDDTNKSLYKRIYHNIPYLLNTKGTIPGLRALITSYGIPDTILRISEFGGKDKVNENDWDFYFHKFNYAWDTQGTNSMNTPWEVNSNFRNHPYDAPGTVEFRFKTTGLPDSRVSQSLWFTTSSAGIDKAIVLEYTGSYLNSGSYSGSIPDPYYQYGNLKYISNPGTVNEVSCSVYLPFFDGEWWSVMVRNNGFDTFDPEYIITEPVDYDFIASEDGSTYIVRESSTTESLSRLGNISLFAANKIYNGNDGTQLGFKASSSITDSNASSSWISGIDSHFAKDFSAGSTYQNFSGSMQEVRYYNIALGTTRFYDYTMNPLSIEGNGVNASPNELTFRAGLASEGSLEIGENEIITQFGEFLTTQDGAIYITEPGGLSGVAGNSIHPKVTGSWTPIPSFATSSTYNFEEGVLFVPNREYYFLDQFPAGIKNRITDKIRFENNSLPPGGDSLSPFIKVTQNTEASASYTDSINYLEVAFSPQNEINDDIISQIGYFNVGDYIGDPRQRSSSAQIYPDLNALSEDYFKKYTHNYDLTDFVRLIKFFDNSLFKMIKDFIPVRTSLASGLVVKQHLLERNKYPQPQVSYENKIYTGSIDMVDISGGPGGVFNELNAPAPEIIMSFAANWTIPFPGVLLPQYFQNFSASIHSTIRGKINEYNVLSGSITTTEPIKMYDGENFYLETKASSSNFFAGIFEWKIDPSSGATSDDYGFWSVGAIPPFSSTSSFVPTQTFRVTSSAPGYDPDQVYQGKNVVWDEDKGYLNMNYLPKDTLYKQDVNFQRWDESFSSVIGEIPKLHDNQGEFYDGEFSGSVILVTNGELNEDCEGVKGNVVYPPIEYRVRIYGSDQGEIFSPNYSYSIWNTQLNDPYPGFISIPLHSIESIRIVSFYNGVPQFATIPIAFGTEKIKISKTNANGQDMTPSLSQLNSIKIEFDDIGLVTYDVDPLQTVQRQHYFEYTLTKYQNYGWGGGNGLPGSASFYPNGYTGSLAKPEYKFTASVSDSLAGSTPIPVPISRNYVIDILPPDSDPNNMYYEGVTTNPLVGNNAPVKVIKINTYPQKDIDIRISGSISLNGTIGDTADFSVNYTNDPNNVNPIAADRISNVVLSAAVTSSFDQTVTLSIPPNTPVGGNISLAITTRNASITQATVDDVKIFVSSTPVTGSKLLSITDPYLISKFENSDCDVLQGEATEARPNPYLQDLDYDTSQTVPVNYQVVVSQSATRATVPESYYTSPAQINSRYVGSKNQSIDFNIYQPLGVGGQTTTDFGNPINIGTYGQLPSVSSNEAVIYEYEWAGGTTPEIWGWNALKMGKILQVDDATAVKTITDGQNSSIQYNSRRITPASQSYYSASALLTQSISEYYLTLNNNNRVNDEISILTYGSSDVSSGPTVPQTSKILTTEFGVPIVSNYLLTSSYQESGGNPAAVWEYGSNTINFSSSVEINPLKPGYEFDTVKGPQDMNQIRNQIDLDLSNNERWFITLYTNLEYGFESDNLIPFYKYPQIWGPTLYPSQISFPFIDKDSKGNFKNPLSAAGVFEILGIHYDAANSIYKFLVSDTNLTVVNSVNYNIEIGDGNSSDFGALIWKGRASNKNEFVITQNESAGSNGPGAFISRYSPDYLVNNFEDITKKYGSNKQ